MKQLRLTDRIFRPYYRFLDRWAAASRKRRIWMFLGVYTAVFCVTFCLSLIRIIIEGYSIACLGDSSGLCSMLAYLGQYFRQSISSLFQGKPEFSMFNLCLGFGEGIAGPLANSYLGNPIALLSALVPVPYTEYLYNFLAVLSLYLSGLSFCALCRSHGRRACYALIGSVIYVFSGYALSCYAFPVFLSPMIQLPLLVIGTDKIIRGKSPLVFILSVFYSALCGFYFLYMMTIIIAVYALVLFFNTVPEKTPARFLKLLGCGAGSYILGVCLAGALFFPGVAAYFSSPRVGTEMEFNLLSYGLQYYLTRLPKAFAPTGSNECLALAVTAALAVVLLFRDFIRAKQHRCLVCLLLIAAVAYALPICGFVLSGFSYPSQRWTFAAVLLLSYITVEMMPALLQLNGAWRAALLGIFSLYVIVYHGLRGAGGTALIMLAVTLAVLPLLSVNLHGPMSQAGRKYPLVTAACLLLTMGNVIVNGIFAFSSNPVAFTLEKSLDPFGAYIDRMMSSPERLLSETPGSFEGRSDGDCLSSNYSLIWTVPTQQSYLSLCNGATMQFHKELQNAQMTLPHLVSGVDLRTALGTLLSNRYYVTQAGAQPQVPFGYRLTEEVDGYLIYENDYSLPWGYTYGSVVSYDALEPLNGLEKQEAVLQAIALDESSSLTQVTQPRFTNESIPYTITCNGVQWENGILTVETAEGSITLEYAMPQNTEGYILLDGFDLESSGRSWTGIEFESNDGVKKQTSMHFSTNQYYFGQTGCLANLGYSQEERTSCTIFFGQVGTYRLADIQVYAQPMDSYVEYVEALREEPLENIVMGTNEISGTVDLSRDKILCLSIPYSRGWSATVDGQPVEILRGNYMFMAIPLQAGYHEIELHYFTPGLKLGLAATGASAVILAAMLLLDRKKRRRS